MKLRIRGNSLRLRLLRGEIEQFGKTGCLAETIRFGAAQLIYSLEMRSEAQRITANFADSQITITIPETIARNWIDSEQSGLTGEQLIERDAPENMLKITIEKDFVCLERRDDPENADAFPHPLEKCA